MNRSHRRRLLTAALAFALLAVACGDAEADRLEAREELDDNVEFVSVEWPTDWTKTTVGLDELVLGVAATRPLDAIPPIDEPVYESVGEAAGWLEDREPGALVQVGGEVRFYPLSIMNRHEVVNDVIEGVPVAVTFCPLCNTAIAFDRRVDGETLRMGVSGLLRNSDLVMWDDATTSLWQQITGEAIVGEFAGTKLEQLSSAIVRFGDYRTDFPDGLSLSRDTGFDLSYGINRYEGYSGRFAPIFPVGGETDGRFFPMERVVGVTIGETSKAYPFEILAEERAVNDTVDGRPVVVFWGSPDTADALSAEVIAESRGIGTALALDPVVGGQTLTFAADGDDFVDAETGSRWTILGRAVDGPLAGTQLSTVTHRNEFWFAWTAFFPEADVYGP